MSRRSVRAATPGRASCREAPEALSVLTLDLHLRSAQDLALRYQDQIEPGQELVEAEGLAQQPLRAVALDGRPHLSRRGQPEPAIGPPVGRGHHQEERPVEAE